MSLDRAENNRRLAEWVGWKYIPLDWDSDGRITGPVGRWRDLDGHPRLDPPDFYESEAANAMLLEKMPPLTTLWSYGPQAYWVVGDSPFNGDHRGVLAKHTDRKTAICNAALALLEADGR